MSTFNQLRTELSKAWDSVTEGWREFRDLAGDALTKFHPKTSRADESETAEDRITNRASRWGLLAAEVTDDGEVVQVMLEAPGLEAKDIDLEVRDDILIVKGEKRVSRDRSVGHYHVMERAYGSFERAIRLPSSVDKDSAKAKYQAGVLTVTLNTAAADRTKRITVEER